MKIRLVAISYDEYMKQPINHPLPLAQEFIRQGEITLIDYLADEQTFGAFRANPSIVSGAESKFGLALYEAIIGAPVLLLAFGNVQDTPKSQKVWVIEDAA
jgi:hypothetical protein